MEVRKVLVIEKERVGKETAGPPIFLYPCFLPVHILFGTSANGKSPAIDSSIDMDPRGASVTVARKYPNTTVTASSKFQIEAASIPRYYLLIYLIATKIVYGVHLSRFHASTQSSPCAHVTLIGVLMQSSTREPLPIF